MADPSERALVPMGQEQGARKQIVADRRAAGVPLGTSPNPQPPPDMLQVATPTRQPSIDAILNPVPVDPKIKVREMRDLAQNVVVRELLSRMIGE